jgi:hypothetical protein
MQQAKTSVIVKLAAVVGILFIVAYAVFRVAPQYFNSTFLSNSSPNTAELKNMPVETSLSTEQITIPLGQTTLHIPRNYFYLLPNASNGALPTGTAFTLIVKLPDLTPRDANNEDVFNEPTLHNKIKIFVHYKSTMKTGKELFYLFYSQKLPEELPDDSTGYKRFRWVEKNEQGFFKGTASAPESFAICWGESLPGPSCERTVKIGDNIVMQYVFARAYLRDADAIEPQIIKLLNQFRDGGTEFTAIE